MSFASFLDELQPINSDECDEWQEVLADDLRCARGPNPALFWYMSSGVDTQALAYFSDKDVYEQYDTPSVDAFVYSDYSESAYREIRKHYDALDDGPVQVYRDGRSRVEITQMIPLRLFDDEQRERLAAKYAENVGGAVCRPIRDDGWDFVFISVDFWSNYFGYEYFSILWSSLENWLLMHEVWIPHDVQFTYLCGVCDGCRKGGAYRCVDREYRDFRSVAADPCYWIADHEVPPGDEVATLGGWGHYGGKSTMVRLRDAALPYDARDATQQSPDALQ